MMTCCLSPQTVFRRHLFHDVMLRYNRIQDALDTPSLLSQSRIVVPASAIIYQNAFYLSRTNCTLLHEFSVPFTLLILKLLLLISV